MRNLYLDFSLISIDSDRVFSTHEKNFCLLRKNYRLLILDSLPQTVIEYHVINC